MTFGKRLFDLILALVLLGPLLLLGAGIAALILLRDGMPIFFRAERMRSPTESFHLLKFRTMTESAQDSGVSGQDKAHRITQTGAMLRQRRLDEIPQIWNVLRGDISFVGPRPPLREYVARFPDLYAQVLKARPGITGLATLLYKDTEGKLLATCQTASETDAVYARRCVPQKAKIDLIYRDHRSLCWDGLLVWATVFPGALRKKSLKNRRN